MQWNINYYCSKVFGTYAYPYLKAVEIDFRRFTKCNLIVFTLSFESLYIRKNPKILIAKNKITVYFKL